jgi:hypothetical protein
LKSTLSGHGEGATVAVGRSEGMPKLRNDDPIEAAVERCANLTIAYFFAADETRAAELEAESAAAFVAVVRAMVVRRRGQTD